MTDYQLWSLVIDAAIAIGTIGAVIVALWATLKRDINFVIHDIRGQALFTSASNVNGNSERVEVIMLIENKLPAPLRIYPLLISFERENERSSHGIFLNTETNTIPAHSRFEVHFLLTRDLEYGSTQNTTQITYTFKSSAGDEHGVFPSKWEHILTLGAEKHKSER